MNLLQAVGQALDFVWKACHSYAQTPEGAKELNDVIVALEGEQPSSEQTLSTLDQARRAAKSREG